ncbi:hypothetical protein B0H11DRAFT_915195 [Mycena galericulata]|nr:hypothetical protein B0H11DRAFT_915195 [Mycena galericulata]
MMSPREDLAYSLFGGPLILDVGPTVNGQMIRVRVQPINTISVTALIISIILFLGFMWFYLHPLLRNRRALSAAAHACTRDAEQPGSPIDEEEKNSLLSWLHFRSRDRFSTAHNSPDTKDSSKFASPVSMPPGLKRQPSSFARGSLIPHLSPGTLTPPPPAYASRPNSPLALAEFRFPSPLSSPRSDASRSPPSRSPCLSLSSPALPASTVPAPTSARVTPTPRVQFDPRSMPSRPRTASPAPRGRSGSGTSPSSTLAVRPVMAPRSVSANTLHPMTADMHVPARAMVYCAGESEGGDSAVRSIARPREGNLGISLAQRGRVLTRGPSSSWNPSVRGEGRVGPPF